MATEQKAQTDEERIVEVIADGGGFVQKVQLSKKAWSQLTKLRQIFDKNATGNEETQIEFRTVNHLEYKNGIQVDLWPYSVAMSKKTGRSKGFLIANREITGNLSRVFNQAVDELYSKAMDADTIIVFNCWEHTEEPEALFVVKNGKLQLGIG